ncbi:DUF1566 domain-containing protein [Desulfonatronovibrio magnus]|uniref:Lcl C-terminal domain-containing protein n=1 Tax=Desulfonatronovibrio magnus TaxID=698827 RepID=UPI0005EB64B2|nr:DUF1566 domain-containing protein [Desulfonatronovibrio magnus]
MLQQKWFVITAIAFMLFLAGLVMSGTAFGAGGGQCEDNGDGTLTDYGSGLMWQKATPGYMDWPDARRYPSNLSLGGYSNWRLPTWNELERLFKSECINLIDHPEYYYWSDTPVVVGKGGAWRVDFQNVPIYMWIEHYVRAVRWAQ